MKKIEINLYPYAGDGRDKFIDLLEKFLPAVFLTLCGFIIINIVLFVFTVSSISVRGELGKKWKNIIPKSEALSALKKEVDSLRVKQADYQNLTGATLRVSRLLADIFKSLPENIWFEGISMKDNSLSFSGYAVRWKEDYLVSIQSFIRNLQKEKLGEVFKDINLKNSRKNHLSGTEVMRFEIECKNSN